MLSFPFSLLFDGVPTGLAVLAQMLLEQRAHEIARTAVALAAVLHQVLLELPVEIVGDAFFSAAGSESGFTTFSTIVSWRSTISLEVSVKKLLMAESAFLVLAITASPPPCPESPRSRPPRGRPAAPRTPVG